jgi:hypothetical protein
MARRGSIDPKEQIESASEECVIGVTGRLIE